MKTRLGTLLEFSYTIKLDKELCIKSQKEI